MTETFGSQQQEEVKMEEIGAGLTWDEWQGAQG